MKRLATCIKEMDAKSPRALQPTDRAELRRRVEENLVVLKKKSLAERAAVDAMILSATAERQAITDMHAEAHNNVLYMKQEISNQNGGNIFKETPSADIADSERTGVPTEPSGEVVADTGGKGRRGRRAAGQPEPAGLVPTGPSIGDNQGTARSKPGTLAERIAQTEAKIAAKAERLEDTTSLEELLHKLHNEQRAATSKAEEEDAVRADRDNTPVGEAAEDWDQSLQKVVPADEATAGIDTRIAEAQARIKKLTQQRVDEHNKDLEAEKRELAELRKERTAIAKVSMLLEEGSYEQAVEHQVANGVIDPKNAPFFRAILDGNSKEALQFAAKHGGPRDQLVARMLLSTNVLPGLAFKNHGDPRVGGTADVHADVANMDAGVFIQQPRDIQQLVGVLVHEVMHSATVAAMYRAVAAAKYWSGPISERAPPTKEQIAYKNSAEYRAGKELVRLFDWLAQNHADEFNTKNHYGATNPLELVAEAYSDKKLQEFLARTALPSEFTRGSIQKALHWFLNRLNTLMGIQAVPNSALEHVLRNTSEVVRGREQNSGRATLTQEEEAGRAQLDSKYKKGNTAPVLAKRVTVGLGGEATDDAPAAVIQKQKSTYKGATPIDNKGWAGFVRSLTSGDAANKVFGKMTAFEQRIADSDKFDAAQGFFTYKGKRQIMGHVSGAQAENFMNLKSGIMEYGRLKIEDNGSVNVEDSPNNILAANKHYVEASKAAAAKYGAEEARIGLTNALALGRYTDIREKLNPAIEAEAVALEEAGHKKKAAKVREMLHDTSEFTLADEVSGKAFMKEFPQIRKALDVMNAVRKDAVHSAVASGLYSQTQAESLLAAADWVPFKRLGYENAQKDSQMLHGKGLRAMMSEHKFKGSQREISNPMENFAESIMWINERAVLNLAAKNMANTMDFMGGIGRWVDDNYTPTPEDTVIKIAEGGKLRQFAVHEAAMAAPFLAYPSLNSRVLDLMGGFSNVLRKAITLNPVFISKQLLMEDPLRMTVTTGIPQGYMTTVAKNLQIMVRNAQGQNTDEAKLARKYGLVGAVDSVDGNKALAHHMAGKEISRWQKSLEAGEVILRASDLANRMNTMQAMANGPHAAELAKMRKAGASAEAIATRKAEQEVEAAYAANNTMRFGNKGTSTLLRATMQVAPFLNPTIQGTLLMYKALKGQVPGMSKSAAQAQLVRRVGTMTLMMAAYAAAVSGDDEYEALGEDAHLRGFHLPIPGTGKFVLLSIPKEFTPLWAATQATVRASAGNLKQDDSAVKAQILASLSAYTFNFGSGFIPTAVAPIAHIALNKNAFGSDLIPASMKAWAPEFQKNENTSEVGIAVGGMIGVSPIIVDSVISGYLGSLGLIAEQASTALAGENLNETIPGLSGLVTKGNEVDKTAYYALREAYTGASQTLAQIVKERPEGAAQFVQDHRSELAYKDLVNQTAGYLKQLKAAHAAVANNPNISRDAKIDQLRELRDVERRIVDRIPDIRHRIDANTGGG